MSKKFYLFTILIGLLFASCKKNDIAYQDNFDKSQQSWLEFKKTNNNSYQYTVTSGTWAGASWETTLRIKQGNIAQRHFKYTYIDEHLKENIPEDQLEWTENENELNAHKSSSAAAVITLDEVYKLAKDVWLKKRKTATAYFEAKNNGLISSCGYVDNNCQDDCFIGISISKIEAL